MAKPSSTPPPDKPATRRRALAWTIFPFAIFALLALLTYDWHAIPLLQQPAKVSSNAVGALGDSFAYYGFMLFGLSVWLIPLLGILAALCRLKGEGVGLIRRTLWFLVVIIAMSGLLQAGADQTPYLRAQAQAVNIPNVGGAVGYLLITRGLSPLISNFAAALILVSALIFAFIAAVGARNIANAFYAIVGWAKPQPRAPANEDEEAVEEPVAKNETPLSREELVKQTRDRQLAEDAAQRDAQLAAIKAARDAARQEQHDAMLPGFEESPEKEVRVPMPQKRTPPKRSNATTKPKPTPVEQPEPPVDDKGPYVIPPISLLNPLKPSTADHGDVNEMSERLVNTLKLFGVEANVAYNIQGPVVTKYALSLAPGTKYSAVTNISDNLMGALHAKSLRIEAPIPGEDHIGVEVPNRSPAGISFREIFESAAWRNCKGALPLLFGKDAAGHELVADLAKMPHMLVAGATGQGKSVCLNAIINGLLMTKKPEELKLIMVDPKSVEFTSYAAIPHLIVPIITENRKAATALAWAVAEMEKRLKLFARARVRNIGDFNNRLQFTQTDMFGADSELGNNDMPKTVPYIVIIIDEVADLMSQCAKDVVPHISRLTAKARAAGIHLILATQRPDAKVITGTIKANIPGRVAFKTATSIDSRTILDDTGAENLIGRGDMLFKASDGVLIRAQGAWISDEEIARVTAFIEEHASPQFDDKFTKNLERIKDVEIDPFAEINDADSAAAAKEEQAAAREQVKADAAASDFKKAVECVINTQRASTSHFQRQMGWGYNHAAKILDMLTERGVVGPQVGMGPRQIIMNPAELEALFNNADGDAGGEAPEAAADGLDETDATDATPFETELSSDAGEANLQENEV